jgi:hypothetical protein
MTTKGCSTDVSGEAGKSTHWPLQVEDSALPGKVSAGEKARADSRIGV